MSRKDIDERGDPGLGKRAEKKPGAFDDQRDPDQDVGHMPRHWQAPGTRGEVAGQPPPEPDQREVARGNQYGEAGEVASKQVHADQDEHGQTPAPQRRENEQLPKRAGEAADDLPTVQEGKPQPPDLPTPQGGKR